MIIAPLIMIEAAAAAGGLSVVQEPPATEPDYGPVAEQALTAVGSGNSVVMMVTSTNSSAPTITDSGGGSWTSLHSYTGSDQTTRFYKRDSATGITWVRATYGTDGFQFIAAAEFSGVGTGITLDDTPGGAAQSTNTAWTAPFTSTVDDAYLMFTGVMTTAATPTGVSPLTAYSGLSGSNFYASGMFPTAGSNTGQVDLSAGRNGSKAWIVLRPGT